MATANLENRISETEEQEKVVDFNPVEGIDVEVTVDQITRKHGYSTLATASGVNLYGINHTKIKLPFALNQDQYGYVFFTRPDLRLTYDNLVQDRYLAFMTTPDKLSMWNWVRATLDPRGAKSYGSPFVDNNNPFIPVLSNNLETLTGWNDIPVDPWTSDPGIYNEAWSQMDGMATDYSVKTLSATFTNQINDPLNKLFHVWTRYGMLAHEGIVDPYLNNLVLNIMDYNTRIYRIVTDHTKQYIQGIAACGAAFPLNSQLASKFDYNYEKPFNEENNSISIQFQIMGTMLDDPILLKEFNMLVESFVGQHPSKDGRYVKLRTDELKLFNNLALPYIDLSEGKLEWWVHKQDYNYLLTRYMKKTTKTNTRGTARVNTRSSSRTT